MLASPPCSRSSMVLDLDSRKSFNQVSLAQGTHKKKSPLEWVPSQQGHAKHLMLPFKTEEVLFIYLCYFVSYFPSYC